MVTSLLNSATPDYDDIENLELPFGKCVDKVAEWRDKRSYSAWYMGIGRKVVAGAALAGLGLAFLIDAITSLALAILTSPLALFGVSIGKSFLIRAMCASYFSGYLLTFAHYDNIVTEKLGFKIAQRMGD